MAWLRDPLSAALRAVAIAVLGAGLSAAEARAQEGRHAPVEPPLGAGPTLEARAATAHQLVDPTSTKFQVLPLYRAFEREFAADFGFPLDGAGSVSRDEADFMRQVRRWLALQWGDTSMYQWVERALVLYAHVQASTRFETRGFDMGVEVDDVTDGKLGVRVSRSLE